jgi:uncharacterized membrane protein (UPF0127 family)
MRAIGVRLWAALTFVVFVAASAGYPARGEGLEALEIATSTGRHAFQVEIAKDDATRERGLMDRRYMAADRGMLFEFDRDGPTAFWMKNTYIPLDMIFIRGDGSILRIAENTEPLSDRLVPSGGPVRAVLEVIGGTARKLGIAPGDHVTGSIFDGSH